MKFDYKPLLGILLGIGLTVAGTAMNYDLKSAVCGTTTPTAEVAK